eukprot:scaffold248404_cov65-Cyclotella_meneghiniana.AAC.8
MMTTSSFNKSRLYLYHTAAWGSVGGLECCGADGVSQSIVGDSMKVAKMAYRVSVHCASSL